MSSLAASRLVAPNLHVALVHLPIGLLLTGLCVEIFGFLYRRSTLRPAGRWMIALGVFSMIPVSLSGTYAMADVTRRSLPAGERADVPWADVMKDSTLTRPVVTQGSPRETPSWTLLAGHAWRMVAATLLAALAVVVWVSASDRWRRRLYVPTGLALLFATTVMLWGAWMAGEAVYERGVGVRLDENRSLPTPIQPATQPGAARDMTEARPAASAGFILPPLQTHLILGGTAIAVALAAVALSFRNTTKQERATAEQERAMLDATSSPGRRPAVPDDLAMVRSFQPEAAVYVETPVAAAPAARLWILAALVTVVAALTGWWFLAEQTGASATLRQSPTEFVAELWGHVVAPQALPNTSTTAAPPPTSGLTRRLLHGIGGGAFFVALLLLAGVARFAPRRRLLLGGLATLLLLAVAVQAWAGVLLLFDTPAGGVTSFNPPLVNAMAE